MRRFIAKFVFGALLATAGISGAIAAEHQIQMLDTGPDGSIMVFDPPYLKIDKGDTVTFVAKDPGHNVISGYVPDGSRTWKGTVSHSLSVKLDTEGVYIYECDLHNPLGMVGVIQVGNPVNLDAARQAAANISKRMAMGGDRLQSYLDKVH